MVVMKLTSWNGLRQKRLFFLGPFDIKIVFRFEKARGKNHFCQKSIFFFLYNKEKKVFLSKKCFLFLYNMVKKEILW